MVLEDVRRHQPLPAWPCGEEEPFEEEDGCAPHAGAVAAAGSGGEGGPGWGLLLRRRTAAICTPSMGAAVRVAVCLLPTRTRNALMAAPIHPRETPFIAR